MLCGGGAAAGAYMYSSNPDFRAFVNKSLPIIETFNLALGPASSNNNSDEKSDDTTSMMRVPTSSGIPSIETLTHGSEPKPVTEIVPKVTHVRDGSIDINFRGRTRSSAGLSSLDAPPFFTFIFLYFLLHIKIFFCPQKLFKNFFGNCPIPPSPPQILIFN